MIHNHKARGEWKIQLTMRITFVSFIDANETREMHTKSDNITIMIGIETEDAINELFNTFRKRTLLRADHGAACKLMVCRKI